MDTNREPEDQRGKTARGGPVRCVDEHVFRGLFVQKFRTTPPPVQNNLFLTEENKREIWCGFVEEIDD